MAQVFSKGRDWEQAQVDAGWTGSVQEKTGGRSKGVPAQVVPGDTEKKGAMSRFE